MRFQTTLAAALYATTAYCFKATIHPTPNGKNCTITIKDWEGFSGETGDIAAWDENNRRCYGSGRLDNIMSVGWPGNDAGAHPQFEYYHKDCQWVRPGTLLMIGKNAGDGTDNFTKTPYHQWYTLIDPTAIGVEQDIEWSQYTRKYLPMVDVLDGSYLCNGPTSASSAPPYYPGA